MVVSLKDLRKPTLSETFLNLQQLLSTESTSNLNKLVDSSVSHNWDAFDQSLRVIIVDKTQNSEELARILFGTDSGLIRRAVKCKWFFKTTPVIFFTDQLLPVVSVSTRLKVISALSKVKNGDDAVSLFEWVRSNFGLRIAEPLLVSCPLDYLEKIVLSDIRPIGNRTFLAVARRLPGLAVKIAEIWVKSKRHVPDSVVRELSLSPDLFQDWEYCKLSMIYLKIGRKRLRLWKNRLERIGPKAAKLLSRNQEPRLFRSFSHDIRVKYLAQVVPCVPYTSRITLQQWDQKLTRFHSLIHKIDAKNRDQLLHDAFQLVFGKDLWDAKEALVPKLLELLSYDQRQMLLEKFQLNGDEYIYLKPAEEAVPILVQKVKQCSEPVERSEIVTSMVKSCILSWDLPQLEYVINYVNDNHKKHPSILCKFFNTKLPLNLISLDASRSLTEIAHTAAHVIPPLLWVHENYLTRLLQANLPMDDALALWFKDCVKLCLSYEILPLMQKPNKKLFEIFYKFFPEILKALDDVSNSSCAEIFFQAQIMCKIQVNELHDNGSAFFEILENLDRQSGIFKVYHGDRLENIVAHHCLLTWFLHFRPEFVQENIEEILNLILEIPRRIDRRFFGCRHLLLFYKLDRIIAKFCEEKFHNATTDEKIRLLEMYSFVAEIEEFKQLAGEYLTDGARVDTLNNDAKIFVLVPRYLKHLQPIGGVFPLAKGCLVGGGDLFYAGLSTFHKACYNSPVDQTLKEVTPLLESPVSVMKKAVAILANVCTRTEASCVFRAAWKNARHYSARTVLLEHMLGLFLDDPSDETWKCVEQCIVQLDDKLLGVFPSFQRIPDNYIKRFSSVFWNSLDQCRSNTVETIRLRLVHESTHRVHLLSNELCQKIISRWFLLDNCEIYTFTVKYLSRGETELGEKLQFIENIVKLRLDAYPRGFIDFVLTIAAEDLSNIFPFLSEFMACLETILTRVDLFEARWPLLYLRVLQSAELCSGKTDCEKLRSVGQEIAALWMSEPDRNGLHPLLANSLKNVFQGRLELLAVVSGIVCDDPAVNIAVLLSMEHGSCTREDLKEAVFGDDQEVLHKYVLCQLSQCQNDAVQTYLSEFLALENKNNSGLDHLNCISVTKISTN